MTRFVHLAVIVTACTQPAGDDLDPGKLDDGLVVGGDRPVAVQVPRDAAAPAPLLIALHGYTVTGAGVEQYLRLGVAAAERGMIYATPNGTVDAVGLQFWNATPGCCDLFGAEVDDSAYLAGVIAEIRERANVDPQRIYVAGHSNGGFMSHRMACDHADTIAAIASLAGATFVNPADCAPAAPVAVLQIHGTADGVIPFDGDGDVVPSAPQTVRTWADLDGCDAEAPGAPRDIDARLAGDETTVARFANCAAGTGVELWTIAEGTHEPALSQTFADQVVDFLLAHPKSK